MAKCLKIFVLFALMALGILAPNAMAGGSDNCPTGDCKYMSAEWVPGLTVAAETGGSEASTTLVKEVPVSKIKKVIRKEEKRKKIKIGFYQNPQGYQGSASCIDPTKVKRWNFHAGEFYKTTNHLREPVPPAQWKKGDRICDWKEVKIGGKRYVTGVQELCANVKSWIPIATTVIKKPKYVYVQYPTIQKYWEVKMKRTEVKSEAKSAPAGAIATTEGHYTCPSGWDLVSGNKCKKCPPPHCEEKEPPCKIECEPPPCEYECIPDHKPQISCVYPPHIYVGGSQAMFCEASDPDGDTVSVNVIGDSYAHVNSTIPVNERWDGSPCPSGVHCYRSTLWGKQAGVSHIVATVSANGKEAKSEGTVNVEEDEF